MHFKQQVSAKYIIASPMEPTKRIRNKDGIIVEVFEKGGDSEMRAILWPNLTHNGGVWMPAVHLKVFEKRADDKPILTKNVFMSKKEFAECGLNKKSSEEEKKKKFFEYIDLHKNKYRAQMNQIFNEAEREIEALKKHTPQEGGTAITPSVIALLKDFIYSPNDSHTKDLLIDMKDKGYLRPMLRGERKGQLLTDMKAINRVVLDRKLSITPTGISALIAKDLSDKLIKWSRWGYSASLITDISWWARHVSEQFGFSPEETKAFADHSHKAVEHYSKEIYNIVLVFNQKLKEKAQENTPD